RALPHVGPPGGKERNETVGASVPLALDLADRLACWDPPAVLVRRAVGDVGDVDKRVLEERGQTVGEVRDEIVTRLRSRFCSEARGQVRLRDAVDLHGDPVRVTPLLRPSV